MDESISHVILEESHRNRTEAEEYLNINIIANYPEIMSAIQSKRAAHSLLISQRGFNYFIPYDYDLIRVCYEKIQSWSN